MVLSPLEVMGMFVCYGMQFAPVGILFFLALVRYSSYVASNRRTAQTHKAPLSNGDPLEFCASHASRHDYDACRRTTPVVLPFGLYLSWLVVNAGIETAATFLVWFDPASYHGWVYMSSMSLQFAITIVKIFWLIALFDAAFYKGAAVAALALLVLSVINFIFLVADDASIVYNWVLDALVVCFYLYTFFLMVHFYHLSERRRGFRGRDTGTRFLDLFGLLFPPDFPSASAYHGSYVDQSNHFRERERTMPLAAARA
jgi:hypothetical protein